MPNQGQPFDYGQYLANGSWPLQTLQQLGGGGNWPGGSMGQMPGMLSQSPMPQATSTPGVGPAWTTTGGGMAGLPPTPLGPQQGLLNNWFTNASLGGGNIPGANTLFGMSQGQIPPAILANFQNELARSNAATTETMGKVGNRFGTDLAGTLSRNSSQANVALQAQMADRALAAISQILGLGGQTAGMEFGATQSALQRAFQEFALKQQSMMSLIPALLGAA